MQDSVRTYVSKSNYSQIREIQGFPSSVTFNDALTELLKKFKKGVKF